MLSGRNLSVYGIPVYYILVIAPHFYAVQMIKKTSKNCWDNSNPRSSNLDATLRKSVPAATYARYERAAGAHKNGMENLSLFIGAVILGNMARLPARTLNRFVGSYLALRIAYVFAYINIPTKEWSYIRSGFFVTGTTLLMTLIMKAAGALAMGH